MKLCIINIVIALIFQTAEMYILDYYDSLTSLSHESTEKGTDYFQISDQLFKGPDCEPFKYKYGNANDNYIDGGEDPKGDAIKDGDCETAQFLKEKETIENVPENYICSNSGILQAENSHENTNSTDDSSQKDKQARLNKQTKNKLGEGFNKKIYNKSLSTRQRQNKVQHSSHNNCKESIDQRDEKNALEKMLINSDLNFIIDHIAEKVNSEHETGREIRSEINGPNKISYFPTRDKLKFLTLRMPRVLEKSPGTIIPPQGKGAFIIPNPLCTTDKDSSTFPIGKLTTTLFPFHGDNINFLKKYSEFQKPNLLPNEITRNPVKINKNDLLNILLTLLKYHNSLSDKGIKKNENLQGPAKVGEIFRTGTQEASGGNETKTIISLPVNCDERKGMNLFNEKNLKQKLDLQLKDNSESLKTDNGINYKTPSPYLKSPEFVDTFEIMEKQANSNKTVNITKPYIPKTSNLSDYRAENDLSKKPFNKNMMHYLLNKDKNEDGNEDFFEFEEFKEKSKENSSLIHDLVNDLIKIGQTKDFTVFLEQLHEDDEHLRKLANIRQY